MSCNDSGQSIKNVAMNKLVLQLEAEKNKFTINERVNLKVALINQSPDTLLINNGFLIGYEEEEDREIYFKIFSSDSKRYDFPKDHQADILPLPHSQTNMQKLAPGEYIKNVIELTSIYQLKECGKYKVVGVYESKPFENTEGVYQTPVYSDTLEVEIIK
jgi:hypothetical protein